MMDDQLLYGVAQRLMVGMQGDRLMDFLASGVGGLIAFTPDVAGQSPSAIQQRLAMLQGSRLPDSLPLWMGIDQEGGPVERLSPEQVPSLPSAQSLTYLTAEAQHKAVTSQAKALSSLGFNMTFSPVLDVNTEATNPVIGPRAYSADPQQVSEMGYRVWQAYQAQGLLAVGKHFPGHGGGVVDSHEALPVLPLSPVHIAPFQSLITAGLPAVMVAHGYYAGACEDTRTPASLSPKVIQQLLRQGLGFEGLVITDDLQMGAIEGDPVEVAIRALAAGNDMLLYREAGDKEWAVLNGIVRALQDGRLSITQHQQAIERIATAKLSLLKQASADETLAVSPMAGYPTPAALIDEATALNLAVLRAQAPSPQWLSEWLASKKPLTLVHPDPSSLAGYLSVPAEALPQALLQQHVPLSEASVAYKPLAQQPLTHQHMTHQAVTIPSLSSLLALDASSPLVFIASHLARCPQQQAFYQQLVASGQPHWVGNLGWQTPEFTQGSPNEAGVVQLPGYRLPALQALVQYLMGENLT
jgi:beta-N-acetylhexosaminidase